MFEKTKLLMTVVFTLCFLSYSFLIGKFYDKLHLSRGAMIVICVILTAAVAATFIIDLVVTKRSTDRQPKGKE